MSGMVWDEVQRVRTQLAALEERVFVDVEPRDVARVKEAFEALEAAIAEAWPPEAVGTPVRTDEASAVQEVKLRWPAPERDLLPGVLATTAAQDDTKPIEMTEGVHYRTGPDGRRTALQPPLSGYGLRKG